MGYFYFSFQKLIRILFFFTLIISCQNISPETDRRSPLLAAPYFDLKSYFEHKIYQYGKTHKYLKKMLVFQGKKSSLIVNKPNWSNELVFFLEADLAKPSWEGKFDRKIIDKILVYDALDTDRINIRQVIFYNYKSDNRFDSVKIIKKQSNILSKINAILIFKRDSSYSIKYSENIRFYHKNTFEIKGRIL